MLLGFHFVRLHEDRLAGLFGGDVSRPIIAKYAQMYAEVEFLEKSHRWKPCPFIWDEVERLGWKGAPLCAIVHLLMLRAGKSGQHIEVAVNGIIRVLAAHLAGEAPGHGSLKVLVGRTTDVRSASLSDALTGAGAKRATRWLTVPLEFRGN